jgi:hypothetical protein
MNNANAQTPTTEEKPVQICEVKHQIKPKHHSWITLEVLQIPVGPDGVIAVKAPAEPNHRMVIFFGPKPAKPEYVPPATIENYDEDENEEEDEG